MGHTKKFIFCIFLCLVMFNNVLAKKKKKESTSESSSEEVTTTTTTTTTREPLIFPVGIHCTTNPQMRFWDQPDATRKCCKHAKVPCKQYIKQDHEETNCVVRNKKERSRVIKCCKHKDLTWDNGYNTGTDCEPKGKKKNNNAVDPGFGW